MKKSFYCAVAGVLFCVPIVSHAEVIVNEVAWMGTADSANNEWIELYNNGTDSVDLDGWTLAAADGTPHISLSGSIPAGGYYLLERNDGAVPDITADQIYSGALGNTGESLVMTDGSGSTSDEVDMSSGWLAGNNDTKETMQWNGTEWITAETTPSAANNLVDSGSLSDDNSDNSDDSNDASSTSSSSSSGLSSHSSPEPLSGKTYTTFSLEKGRDRLAVVGEPIDFSTMALLSNGDEVTNAEYEWSMGDGDTERGREVTHSYSYPGDYVVVVNATHGNTEAVARMSVKVVVPQVKIAHADALAIAVENDSEYEINVNGWSLSDGKTEFEFPRDTIILPGTTVLFPEGVTGLGAPAAGQDIVLLDPRGTAVVNATNSPERFASDTTTAAVIENNDAINAQKALTEAESEVAALQAQLAALTGPAHHSALATTHSSTIHSAPVIPPAQTAQAASSSAPALADASTSEAETAAAVEVYRGEAKGGVLHSLVEAIMGIFGHSNSS